MKLIVFISLSFFILIAVRFFSVEKKLCHFKTAHFLIEYQGIYESNAVELASNLEQNYTRIRKDLRDPEHEIIKVFIHANQSEFNSKTGLSNHANGTTRGPLEIHVLWTNWLNSIFPDNPTQTAVHEFAHCVQLNILIKQMLAENPAMSKEDFNRMFEKVFSEKYPQWFWEAISIYEAGEINRLEIFYSKRNNLDLQSLSNSNQIYRIGYTLVEYIAMTYGKEKLPELIRSFFDTKKVLKVSPIAFEAGWKNFVAINY